MTLRLPAKRRSKYGAVRTELDGFTFDSKKEARRYAELRLLEKAGEIIKLQPHPTFPLYSAWSRYHKVCDYVADFIYTRAANGEVVVEDIKGVLTPVYRLKKKFFEAQYGVRITEVR